LFSVRRHPVAACPVGHGHSSFSALSGRAGWDPAVIDISLPDGRGFDLLRACSELDPGKPAVVLTNYIRDPVALVRPHLAQMPCSTCPSNSISFSPTARDWPIDRESQVPRQGTAVAKFEGRSRNERPT